MDVKDLMSREVVTIEETASCHEAVKRMGQHKIRHLPVIGADGTLRGIVTDRDLRHQLFAPNVFNHIGAIPVERLLEAVPVERIMSTPAIAVRPDDSLENAARLMLEDKVGSLPVVESGRVVGIITETDLLRRIVGAEACCTAVEEIVISFP